MAFLNTFDSLSKVLSNDSPVELIISNNSITIDPNTGNYFFLDGIDTNLTINLSNLTEGYTKTIYLRLNFAEDDIVLSWPTNIKWQEIASPAISAYEDLFILLMTLDGGTTWYSEPVIKTKPIVDLSGYMGNKYPSTKGSLTSLPITDLNYFNSVRPISCYEMLGDCSSLTSIDLSVLDTSNVTDMEGMFYNCSSLTSLDVSNWDTSNVTNMRQMFDHCSSLTSLDVSDFDTSKVTNMLNMFYNCSSLTSLDVSDWDTSKVTDMGNMFRTCSSLTSLDLSNFDTSNVTNINRIFSSCSSLASLDLSNFDTSKVTTSTSETFYNCNLEYMIINSNTVKMTVSNNLNSTCKILVPSSALETYKSHSAWSSRASQFDAIENYTITRSNGTVTVTPNE